MDLVIFRTFFGCKRFSSDYITQFSEQGGVHMGLQLFRSKKIDFSFLSILMVPECSKSAYGQLRSISFKKWKKFYFSAIFENFMVMDANFVITWKPILAYWACSHRGKNGLTDRKIEIFKVHDIDTIIQPREKIHQTHVSLALKTFYDHMRRLWEWQNFKILNLIHPSSSIFCRKCY